MNPFIRHMLLCEDVRPRRGNPHKLDVFGLIHSIGVDVDALPSSVTFCVYVVMTGGRGNGEGRIVIAEADSETEVYVGDGHPMTFPQDPVQVVGAIFRISAWLISRPGLFWVEFRYNGNMISRQSLVVRAQA